MFVPNFITTCNNCSRGCIGRRLDLIIEFEACVSSPTPHMSRTSSLVTNNMKLLVWCGLFISLLVHTAKNEGSPLPRASAKPVNVDPKLDCAVKELAWDFANQLLADQVNIRSTNLHTYYYFHNYDSSSDTSWATKLAELQKVILTVINKLISSNVLSERATQSLKEVLSFSLTAKLRTRMMPCN